MSAPLSAHNGIRHALLGSLCWLLVVAPSASAEEPLGGVTLKTWRDRLWYHLSDWGGNLQDPREDVLSPAGTTSSTILTRQGLLTRFHPNQDDEYRLDERSNGPSLSDDARWHRHREGLRFWIGSINNPQLYTVLQARKGTDLGGGVTLWFEYVREETLEANRNLLLFTFEKSQIVGRPAYTFLTVSPRSYKPAIDLEIGGGYRWDARRHLQVSVAALDLFNNTVFTLFRVKNEPVARSLEYSRQPYALRVEAAASFTARLRGELYGGFILPYAYRVQFLASPADEFTQDGDAAYAGGLIEWTPLDWWTGGVSTTLERADDTRRYQDPTRQAQDESRDEKTTRLGLFTQARPTEAVRVEALAEYVERPEERIFPRNHAADIHHQDREWLASADLTYRHTERWASTVSYYFNDRDARGLPGIALSGRNTRAKLSQSYAFTPRTVATLGVNMDLDPGVLLFDGGSLLVVAFWE